MPTESTLASTQDHFVEFEFGILWIVRRFDGRAKALKGDSIAGDFRSIVKRLGASLAVENYLMIARSAEWQPLYKPGAFACEVQADVD